MQTQTDLFDQLEARGAVGERQTDLEALIAEQDARPVQPVEECSVEKEFDQ